MKHPRLQLNKRAFWCGVAVLVLLRCGLTSFQQAYTWVGGAPLDEDVYKRQAFFMQAGNLAARYGVRLAIEANPPMYTNYLNGTAEAFSLVKRLNNPGLAVNLDLSTMLAQGEKLQNFVDDLKYVSHVHISEPGLAPIQKRPEHKELALLLGAVGYRGFVSVEMARTDLDTVKRTLDYVAEVFQ